MRVMFRGDPMSALASLLILGTLSFGFASGPGSTFSSSLIRVRAEVNEAWTKILSVGGQSQSSVPPEEAACSFYQWYVHVLYQSPEADPFKEHKTDVEKYVTARLLQKLTNSRRTSSVRKGPDVDTEYFFQTLDLDSDWEKNITVSKPTIKDATAVVHVTLSGRDDTGKELKVLLRQENGLWKIDDVELWRQVKVRH